MKEHYKNLVKFVGYMDKLLKRWNLNYQQISSENKLKWEQSEDISKQIINSL